MSVADARLAGLAMALLLYNGPRGESFAQAPVAEKAAGLRVYHIGNSHTHSVRNVLMPLAHAAGHTQHDYSWSSILGAPLRWIRDHDQESGAWEAEPWSQGLAPDRAWDALTLQTFAADDREIEAAVFFAGLALRGNPRCQVYLYTIWPGANDDWENPPAERSEAVTERCAAAIARAYPAAPVPRVLPTSLVLRELGRLADLGQLPGIASRFVLLSDGGHLSNYGSYAVNITFCSMLYDEPPFAYPHRIGDFRRCDKSVKVVDLKKVQYELAPATAHAIQRVVWDVLSTYPAARMSVGLVIADRRLPAAVRGLAYRHPLRALNVTGPAVWSLVEGPGPAGLTLGSDGLLAGVPQTPGDYPMQIRVSADGRQFDKALTLTVSEDRPPAIMERDLPGIALDAYCFQELHAQGGVGARVWRLVEGRLPPGIMLRKPGILVGSPGACGVFHFTVQVEDSRPGQTRSDQRAFAWTIGPASPQALMVQWTAEPITVDGKLTERCWSLDTPIAKKVHGTPGKSASFALLWGGDAKKHQANLYIAIKVLDGPAGRTPQDAVHVFLDTLHNREKVYNAGDCHFVFTRDGKKASLRSKPDWFLKFAVNEMEGGYVMEIAVPAKYFAGEGAWGEFGPHAVYGFDLALEEGTRPISRQVWQGTEKNDEDPSVFGTIVLGDIPAAKPGKPRPGPR